MPLLLILIAVELGILIHLYRINHPPKPQRTTGGKVTFNPQGDSTMADLVLKVGESSTGTFTPTKADGTPNTTATTTSATWSISDSSLTVAINADNTVKVTGAAATTADVSGSVVGTGTDSDGTPWSFTVTFTISVGGVVTVDRTTGGSVSWSSPS